MAHRFLYAVEIKQGEDEEVVEAYYKHLSSIFDRIVNLSAFAFDTPECQSQMYLNAKEE